MAGGVSDPIDDRGLRLFKLHNLNFLATDNGFHCLPVREQQPNDWLMFLDALFRFVGAAIVDASNASVVAAT